MLFAGPAFAQTGSTASPGLTLNQAVQDALAHNAQVSSANTSIQETQKSLTYLGETTPSWTPSPVPGNPYVGNPSQYQASINLAQSDYANQEAWQSYNYTKNTVIFNTMSDYFAAQVAGQAIAAAQAGLKYNQSNYNDTLAEERVGMATQDQVATAAWNLKQAKTGLTTAENELKNAYTALENDTGNSVTGQPDLATAVAYRAGNLFPGLGLDAVTTMAIKTSPQIFTDQSNVFLANEAQDWNQVPGLGPLQALQDQNKLTTDTQAVTQAATTAYTALDNARTSYETAEKQLTAANSALAAAKASLAAGVITNTAYLDAVYQQAQAQLGVLTALEGSQPQGYYVARGNLAVLTGQGSVLPPAVANGQ
jgi:outer membrane protein TolC